MTDSTHKAPFVASRRVEFHNTDAAGIMHFSAYFLLMEEAEHEFLRSRGLSVMMDHQDARISWPRVAASCDYAGAVRFEDELKIHVRIERIGDKSVTFGFTFLHDGREVAQGKITTVCCRIEDRRKPQSISIPTDIRDKLVG